jgi:transcriptional regulatory protein GAL4
MLEEGTLPLVQGLAIMANYLQRSNRPNAGYMVLGWAIRMSIALGLHTPVANRRCSPLEREMRVRVWWSIVTLEAGCSVTFGRPNAIGPVQLHSLPAPLNINDENLTVSTSRVPPDLSQPTLYTALIIQSKLAKVTCSIHDLILHSRPPTVEQIRKYDDRVIKALGDLPDFMQSVDEERDGSGWHLARSVQVWRARDFRTILYRPVLLAAAWDSTNRKTLTDGVKEAIE